jgi:copper chaperone NosL
MEKGGPMRTRVRSALVALAAAWLSSCAGAGQPPAPREIAIGVDACRYCHMAIDAPERAAQWIGDDGRVLVFDEPGCLVAWLDEHPEARGEAYFAAAEDGRWIAAADARFVRGGARTDMGFDVVAFGDTAAAARAAADRGGSVEDWETLIRKGVERGHAH